MKKISILACLLSLAAAAWAGPLEVSGPGQRLAEPRSLLTVGFTVVNNGNKALTVDFLAQQPPFWQLLSAPQSQVIAAGEQTVIPVTVQIPQQASAAESYEIAFTARSGSESARASVKVAVKGQLGASLSFGSSRLQLSQSGQALLPFAVENTGNCPGNFWLRWTLPQGFTIQRLAPKGPLAQGESWEGILVVEAAENATPGSGWLLFELGEGETLLARRRLPVTVLSSVASAQLNPDLLSRLELEGIWAENGAFRWHGSFWGDSSWPGGSLQIDLSRYDSGTEGLWRGLAMWQRDIWSLGFGNTDYAGNTLQEPVEEPGVLFRLQGAGKVTSLFWHPGLPGYFSYRKGGSALTFLMAKKHDFWFYGRSEGGDEKGRVYGEVGMPVAWRIPSSTVSVRLGGQSRTPVSLWVLDWLQAGTETKGRYEDLWRLSVSGQNRPFLFSLYSQYNDLASDPAVVQEREDYAALGLNFPLERGSVTARWGYGVRQEEEEKEEQYGWELVTNKYWGPAHLYLAHNQLPLSLPRDYLRFGFYGKSHSLWLAAAKQSELKELEIGLLYRRQNRNWEFEWQAQENGQFSQAVGVKLTQPFAQRHKLQLGSKLFFHGESPATWEVTVGYGLNTKLPVPFLKTKGRLIGRIFVDENHDGIWQEGEKGISGCGILLDGELVVSQSDGQYEFGSMTPGEYPLFLQAQDLPLGFLPKAVTAAFVRLMAGEETSFDWPLTPGALLKGTLSVSGSQGVYLLLLKDNKVVARAVTASGGSFQFPYVLPGKYQLALAGGQFAASYRLSETEATLKEGEQELNLVLKEEEKPVEQLFRTPEWQVFEVH